MAVERVERLLKRVTAALDSAGVRYAVIGGNAVAAWVATIDDGAVRNTKDVDIMLRRADLPAAAAALAQVGLVQEVVLGITVFVEKDDPRPSRGVHVLLAKEAVRSHDLDVAPDLDAAERSDRGYWVIDLYSLLLMKLLAFRLRDQTHLVDLLLIGLIDASWKSRLPVELQPRFQQVLEAFERERGSGLRG